MGLLREMFQREDRPGPGVGPDEPRKKGLRRLWEVCTRDLMGLFWAGLIALLGMAPWAVLTGWTMQARSLAAVALAGALGGLIAAPELCALADLILRGLRDEPFYGWDAWRRAWKGSLRSCLLPGAVLGLLAALDCFVIRIVLTGSSAPGALLGAAAGLFLLLIDCFTIDTFSEYLHSVRTHSISRIAYSKDNIFLCLADRNSDISRHSLCSNPMIDSILNDRLKYELHRLIIQYFRRCFYFPVQIFLKSYLLYLQVICHM